ncbi:tryptase-like [Convolutriloba macropyga]|uniref:tryptase-like n=1 Tax=Convolutriloba macropyga TaxID=536237 RepID=UPI003F51AC9F
MRRIFFGCLSTIFYVSCHAVHQLLAKKENHGENSTVLQNGLRSSIIDGFGPISRHYFVKIRYKGSEKFCGGVFLSPIWILTAASCLQGDNPSMLRIEVAHFASYRRSPLLLKPLSWTIMDGFQESNVEGEPVKNLALLRLMFPIYRKNQTMFFIPPCESRVTQGTKVGVCGMGQTWAPSGLPVPLPDSLREGYLTVNYIRKPFTPFVTGPFYCEDELICTGSYGSNQFPGNHLNHNDEGSPLYQYDESIPDETLQRYLPKCLYGVASHFKHCLTKKSNEICHSESFFTNVTHFLPWIRNTMAQT